MHAVDSHLFRFQSLTFLCSKRLLKHCAFHALHSTKSNDLWVSDSDLMLLICQSNVQAVTKIRHLLESGNTPGEPQSYLVISHTHWCTQKGVRQVERLLPDSLYVYLKSFYMSSAGPFSGGCSVVWNPTGPQLLIPNLSLRILTLGALYKVNPTFLPFHSQ